MQAYNASTLLYALADPLFQYSDMLPTASLTLQLRRYAHTATLLDTCSSWPDTCDIALKGASVQWHLNIVARQQ